MTADRVVIVGGGQAGFETSTRLRANGFTGEVTIVGDEVGRPTSGSRCRRPTCMPRKVEPSLICGRRRTSKITTSSCCRAALSCVSTDPSAT